jgi:hypothetical protein
MNVEIRTEAAQFPEKEYINGIFLAVTAQWPAAAGIKNIQNTVKATGVHYQQRFWKTK